MEAGSGGGEGVEVVGPKLLLIVVVRRPFAVNLHSQPISGPCTEYGGGFRTVSHATPRNQLRDPC